MSFARATTCLKCPSCSHRLRASVTSPRIHARHPSEGDRTHRTPSLPFRKDLGASMSLATPRLLHAIRTHRTHRTSCFATTQGNRLLSCLARLRLLILLIVLIRLSRHRLSRALNNQDYYKSSARMPRTNGA